MTQVLFKHAKVIDPTSPFHRRRVDILVKNGKIIKIGKSLSNQGTVQIVQSKNLHVSTGFVDIGTQVCDPGFEIRETMQSISQAAFAGGYTTLAPLPNTLPVIQHRSEVEYMQNKGAMVGLKLHPIGALSLDTNGQDMTEMMDMQQAGAIAFSDGRKAIQNGGLLLRSLQYLKSVNGLLIDMPFDQSLTLNGQVHEGPISTQLGMEGIPALSEELMVHRNLSLLEYAESRLHLRCISTKESTSLIKDAQKKGLKVSADVSAFHLYFNDQAVEAFDSNKKVFPPLRDEKHVNALIKGVKDGIFSHISSLHEPLEQERKLLEFPYADFGSLGLESAFAMAMTALKSKMNTEQIVAKFTFGPRGILNLPMPTIEVGKKAELTFFDPDVEWTFEEKNIKSQSKNSAALGQHFIGQVLGVLSGNVFIY